MLTAVVNVKNEQEMLVNCLESLKWVDELIVVLNDSTDDSEKIAKKYTSKVLSVSGRDFSAVKNKGLEQAQGEWVLFVDADERVLSALKDEIATLITSEKSAYALSRRNIIFGQEVKYGPFWPDWVIRLVKKSDCRGWVGKIHEHLEFEGSLGYSQNSLLHLTHRDVDQMVLKSLYWSNFDAELRFDVNHPKMTGVRFLRVFITEIFNQGIKRQGFLSGTVGVMDSLIQIFSLIITYIRLWEMQQSKSRQEVYKEIDRKLLKEDFKF